MTEIELLARLQEGFQNCADAIGEYLETHAPVEKRWFPSKIKWQKAEGPKGEYERSEDYDNPEHKKMLKDLASHDGKMMRGPFFYWTFENGSTVGRKLKKKRKEKQR